jgi:uncharacterized membrane protein YeaQ/YmgE (transglycosylase-associated protein family)
MARPRPVESLMSAESLIIILVIGSIAGWLAGLLFTGSGFGLAVDMLVGIVGGFVGTWLLGQLGASMPGGPFVAAVLTAFLGASALLLLGLFFYRTFPRFRR